MLGYILSGVSVGTLTTISVDRLLALLLGLRYRHVVTLKRTYVGFVCHLFSKVVLESPYNLMVWHYRWNSLSNNLHLFLHKDFRNPPST